MNATELPPLAERLLAWRRDNELTQDEAARMLRVSVQALRHWEHGRRTPNRGTQSWIDHVMAIQSRLPTPWD